MEFPVDVLETTSHGELERSAQIYMNKLLYTDPDHAHYFTLPSGKKVQISVSSVGFVPLYGANLQHKVLALFTPQDQLTAVGLFLANQWYSMEEILKTANSRREGLIKVRSVGERIVLYVLNRSVYRTNEMESGEMPFLCHSENDYAKILWKNGQAVGFYSVKPKGSVCNNSLKQCYFLPVMDSIFVRKAHRGNGYGLQMLEDFVDSFNEDELGLRYPLTPAMTKVCRHYLDRYPADVDLFWEVESVGGPYQRTSVANKLSSTPLNADTYGEGRAEDDGQNGDIFEDQDEDAEETPFNITEEVIVVNKHHKITKEFETPTSTRSHSSEHRWRKRVRDEDEGKGVKSRPDKINRLEMAEEEKLADEPEPEAQTETPIPEEADEDNTSAMQNSTGVEEVEEMEQDASQMVDTSEEDVSAAEDNPEMEINSAVYLQQKEKNAPVAEEENAAENEQEEVDTSGTEQRKGAPAAEEKQEIDFGAEKEKVAAPVSKEKQEEAPTENVEVVAFVSKGKQEGTPSAKKKVVLAVAAKEVQEKDAAAKDKTAITVKEPEGAPLVEELQEVALDIGNEVDSADEQEEEVTSETSDYEVEKLEIDLPTSETSFSLATDAEEEQGPEEATDVLSRIGFTDLFEQSSKEMGRQLSGENENDTLAMEEEVAAQKKDETDDEEEDTNVTEESRTKAVPPTSKRTSRRLIKMTLEDGEEEQGKAKVQEKDKGVSPEEKIAMEEAEHSSEEEEEEEEQVKNPPVIDKRVLRGKPKVIQHMQRNRGKRRGKM